MIKYLQNSCVFMLLAALLVVHSAVAVRGVAAEKPLSLLKAPEKEVVDVKNEDVKEVKNTPPPTKKVPAPRKKRVQKKSNKPKDIVKGLKLDETAVSQPIAQVDEVKPDNEKPLVITKKADEKGKKRIKLLDNAVLDSAPLQPRSLIPEKEKVIARFENNSVGAVVTFLWPAPRKAAAFIKNNKLWIIFDHYVDLEFQDFSNIVGSQKSAERLKIYNLEQYHIDNKATYIVADVNLSTADQDLTITLSRYNNSWILEVSKQYERYSDIPIFVKPMELPTPMIYMLMDNDIGNLINYRDPITGNFMTVVPVDVDGKKVEVEYRFVDLNILNTIQGIAIEKIADDVSIVADKKNLYITSVEGLNISTILGDYTTRAIDDVASEEHSLLNFDQLPQMHFLDGSKYLRDMIANNKSSSKAIAQLNMALFLLKNRMYPEAGAYLKMAKDTNGLVRVSYRAALIGAVIRYMNRDYDRGYQIIDSIDIEDVPIVHHEEIMFWKAVISYKIVDSYKYFARSNTIKLFENHNSNFMKKYPVHILTKVGFDILGDKVERESIEMAERVLSVLRTFDLEEMDLNRLYSDMGQLYASQQKLPDAIGMFDKCIASRFDALHYVKCSWLKSRALYDNKRIASDEFTDRLERLRMIWRGPGINDLEMRILKDLYNTYNSQNQLLQALKIGQVVLDNYPNTIDALRLTGDMSQLFINFFLSKSNAAVIPLKKLEVFYEFKHLLPIGYLGDEIILTIADCLIELDLLNKAADLLQHQVRNRLSGLKKERAINKLMHIYLYNEKPLEALKIVALGHSYGDLPDSIGRERKYMHADALYAAGDPKAAINILKGDFSIQADDIKMKILWAEAKWTEFNDYSEPHIYSIRYSDLPLSESDVVRILKQSISYILSNEIGLFNELYDDVALRLPDNDKHTKIIKLLKDMVKYDKANAIEMAKNINSTKDFAKNFIEILDEDV